MGIGDWAAQPESSTGSHVEDIDAFVREDDWCCSARGTCGSGILPVHGCGCVQELGGAKEFAQRRDALAGELKTGYVLLFANTEEPQANHYREDNDFYYFTGVADVGAVLVMDVEKESAVLFEPEQSARMRKYLELNLLSRGRGGDCTVRIQQA